MLIPQLAVRCQTVRVEVSIINRSTVRNYFSYFWYTMYISFNASVLQYLFVLIIGNTLFRTFQNKYTVKRTLLATFLKSKELSEKISMIEKEYYVSMLIRQFVSLRVACVKSYHARPKVERNATLHRQRMVQYSNVMFLLLYTFSMRFLTF